MPRIGLRDDDWTTCGWGLLSFWYFWRRTMQMVRQPWRQPSTTFTSLLAPQNTKEQHQQKNWWLRLCGDDRVNISRQLCLIDDRLALVTPSPRLRLWLLCVNDDDDDNDHCYHGDGDDGDDDMSVIFQHGCSITSVQFRGIRFFKRTLVVFLDFQHVGFQPG